MFLTVIKQTDIIQGVEKSMILLGNFQNRTLLAKNSSFNELFYFITYCIIIIKYVTWYIGETKNYYMLNETSTLYTTRINEPIPLPNTSHYHPTNKTIERNSKQPSLRPPRCRTYPDKEVEEKNEIGANNLHNQQDRTTIQTAESHDVIESGGKLRRAGKRPVIVAIVIDTLASAERHTNVVCVCF